MNMRIMISLVLAAAALAVGLAGGYWLAGTGGDAPPAAGEGAELPHRAGPFRLDVNVDPTTPVVGDNTLTVRLADRGGDPVTGARIEAVAEMPAMGAMPAMRAPADMSEIRPGLYRGTFEPSMDGAWPLSLTIQKEGLGRAKVSFDLATGRSGLRPASGFDNGGDDGGDDAGDEGEPAPEGTVTVDARRRQLIGVRTGEAAVRSMTRSIRAIGSVAFDETRMADVSLKYEAWVGELHADYVGKRVERGEVLFTVYSPDLYAAQREYLETLRRAGAHSDLSEAARQRLEFWDVSDDFVRELESRGEPLKYVPVRAPIAGTVVTKNVVAGTAHKAGMTLLRIADLSRVWIEAEVYEADVALVEPGMSASVSLSYLPGEPIEGRVDYVYPYLEGGTRTGRLRIALNNPQGRLRPDMYAEVRLAVALGERLAVPEEAVLIAGERRFVFEDLGKGRLAPRRVTTGRRSEGWVEILEGLEPGDRVVTSGNFLVAAESRLKAGLDQW